MVKVPRERLVKSVPLGKRERLRIEERKRIEKSTIIRERNLRADSRRAQKKTGRGGVPPPPLGRPPGTPNRMAAQLKTAIMMAAELEGSDQKGKDGLLGYVRGLARYEKKTFAMLLAKMLPQKITAELDPTSLMAKLIQTAQATRAVRDGQQPTPTMIDVTPKRPPVS